MKPLFNVILLALVVTYSCRENRELKFVRDSNYYIPAYRLTDTVSDKFVFSFYSRYYVFGYHYNKLNFDSVAYDMVCKMLTGDTILSYIFLSFEDVGRYNYYEEGEFLDLILMTIFHLLVGPLKIQTSLFKRVKVTHI
ncbi:MAG: hypothetical protein IPG00_16535 [Saprospiraceae bacterium]|nr:hypothetical protein [Saprospiraceae bacterium]